MNRIKLTIIFVYFSASCLSGQIVDNSINTGFYYTQGIFSNESSSNEYSAYGTLTLNRYDHFILGYDRVDIDDSDWEFKQQMIVAGIIKNLYPFYFKFNYAHLAGDFDINSKYYNLYPLDPDTIRYSDYTNIYNTAIYYSYDLFYFGFNYTYYNKIGDKPATSHNINLHVDYLINSNLDIMVRPGYNTVSDGREFYYLLMRLYFYPGVNTLLMVDGFIGNRVYYFDPEYLTAYNQDNTQTGGIRARGEFSLFEPVKIILSSEYISFKDFNTIYLTGGLRLSFGI